MVFSSVIFLFRFLPFFLICYFVAPRRMRNLILLLGSLFFYAWGEPLYISIMLFSTASDYIHGILIQRCRGRAEAKGLLISSIVMNLCLLGFFKYAGFLPLPIGISFYTFQTMSYTIDVYRGEVRAQKNFLDFAVFVTMFPQLIAGPIVKYRQVEKEIHCRTVDSDEISCGAKRFVAGLAKKVLLANNLGVLWTEVSARAPGELTALAAWLGILAFAFQIYFDFSGYSDMAIGLGAVLGFHFPENFNYPYISASVTEFWRRWHITLGTWLREYVYIPLGGNRKGLKRQLLNLLIVWALTGIWHGAGWNFLMWGMWFGFFLILEKLFLKKILGRLPRAAGWMYTALVVLTGWVLFALESLDTAGAYLAAMIGLGGAGWWDRAALFWGKEYGVLFALAAFASLPLAKWLTDKLQNAQSGAGIALYRLGEKVIPPALLLLSIACVVEASYNPFLYFRF